MRYIFHFVFITPEFREVLKELIVTFYPYILVTFQDGGHTSVFVRPITLNEDSFELLQMADQKIIPQNEPRVSILIVVFCA